MRYYDKTPIHINVKKFINLRDLGYTPSQKYKDESNIINFLINKKYNNIELTPNDSEFIPREYWDDLDNINKTNLRALNHTVWFISNNFVNDNFKPSHKKLYIKEFNRNDIHEIEGYDVVYNSLGIIPLQYVDLYPFRYFSWNTNNISEFIKSCYLQKQCNNILLFLLEFASSYDEIIMEGNEVVYNYIKDYFDVHFINTDNIVCLDKHTVEGIDIKPGLELSDLGYDFANPPIEDDDLFEYWGKKLTVGVRIQPMYKSKKRSSYRTKSDELTREDFIKYTLNQMDAFEEGAYKVTCLRPLTKDNQKYLDRKYFPNLEDLQGENLMLLGHPYWQLTKQITLDNFVPKSDIMSVCSCSNSKPYYDNINYFYVRKRMQEGYGDVFINSFELWPIDFSTNLYARVYDWSHLRETPFVQQALIDVNFCSIIQIYKKFNYKKLVIFGPPPNPNNKDDPSGIFYPLLIEKLRKIIPDLEVVMDDETVEGLLKINGNNYGIVKSRMYGFYLSRHHYDVIIGYPNPTPIDKPGGRKGKKVQAELNKQKSSLQWLLDTCK